MGLGGYQPRVYVPLKALFLVNKYIYLFLASFHDVEEELKSRSLSKPQNLFTLDF